MVSHGFGDILAIDFLPGLAEPTIVILHSNPNNGRGGLAWSGRMAHGSSSCRTPLTLTAISVSISQQRSVVLWTLKDNMPVDTWDIKAHPSNGCLVIGVNEVVYVDNGGQLRAALAVNGWVRATASSSLLSKVQKIREDIHENDSSLALLYQKATKNSSPSFMQPNPSPLPKLSIQLDGSRLVFVGPNVAMVSLRDGSLFTLEIHERTAVSLTRGLPFHKCHNVLSMAPAGKKIGALGMISTLSYVPIARLSGEEKLELDLKNFESLRMLLLSSVKKEEGGDDMYHILQSKFQSANNPTPYSMGILFAGSRFGDSSLMIYGMKENVPFLPWNDEKPSDSTNDPSGLGKRKLGADQKIEDSASLKRETKMKSEEDISLSDDNMTEEQILEREEEMLYDPLPTSSMEHDVATPQVVSDDEMEQKHTILGVRPSFITRPQIRSMAILESMQALDTLTGLGPIGPGCKGPLACSLPNPSDLFKTRLPGTQLTTVGSSTQIHPCGYDTSGGLAILHCPGMNHASTILNEIDCKNIDSVFSSAGYVFLTLDTGGCLTLREKSSKERHIKEETNSDTSGILLEEVDVSSWRHEGTKLSEGNVFKSSIDITSLFSSGSIFFVREHQFLPSMDRPSSVILALYEGKHMIFLVSSENDKNSMIIDYHQTVGLNSMHESTNADAVSMRSFSVMENLDGGRVDDFSCACLWDDDTMSIISVTHDLDGWKVIEAYLPPNIHHSTLDNTASDNEDEVAQFYHSTRIVACDLLSASESLFPPIVETRDSLMDLTKVESSAGSPLDLDFTQDDADLYADDDAIKIRFAPSNAEANIRNDIAPCRYNTLGGFVSGAGLSQRRGNYLVICYQSGRVDVFDLLKLKISCADTAVFHVQRTDLIAACVWSAQGCSLGVPCLSPHHLYSESPKFNKVHISEIKFFFTGPSCNRFSDDSWFLLRSLCLVIETSAGDLNLYTAKTSNSGILEFIRVPLNMISRISKEEGRHATKLKRKGISNQNVKNGYLRKNRLHRFYSISGNDGLFAATARPIWIISERGAPYALYHRLRYAAPAGGRPLPLAGFCSDFKFHLNECQSNCFITLHERIGRVGSQRLTFHSNLSDVFGSHGLLPGGNVSIQKIPLGVTVRKIVFIDDVSISSVTHPIYALLVSRETNKDQSHLHDDSYHAIDRRKAKEEREKEKVRRQVEADLGGFDVEQEWVEDIERDDVFEVETRYGRAPTIPSKVYEVWVCRFQFLLIHN
jgi:cleavage and polyadenylation specificity factor subunit 1